jgi:hypothetical protein
MKQQVSPAVIAVAVVVVLALLGGLYYKFLGPGSVSAQSEVASPYGLPKSPSDFKTPPQGGSGINTITGEPLSESAKKASPRIGFGGPALPAGAKVEPGGAASSSGQSTPP